MDRTKWLLLVGVLAVLGCVSALFESEKALNVRRVRRKRPMHQLTPHQLMPPSKGWGDDRTVIAAVVAANNSSSREYQVPSTVVTGKTKSHAPKRKARLFRYRGHSVYAKS